jgi:hypothetical protein
MIGFLAGFALDAHRLALLSVANALRGQGGGIMSEATGVTSRALALLPLKANTLVNRLGAALLLVILRVLAQMIGGKGTHRWTS